MAEKAITSLCRMKTKYIEKKPGKDLLIPPEFQELLMLMVQLKSIERVIKIDVIINH